MNIDTASLRKLALSKAGSVTRIALRDAEGQGGALDRDLLLELRYVLRGIDRDEECKAVVLIGADAPFIISDDNTTDEALESDLQAQLHDEVLLLLDELRPVTIAVRDGGCENVGDDLAPACDVVVAGVASRNSQPTISWAVAPFPSSKLKLAGIADQLPEIEAIISDALPSADETGQRGSRSQAGAAPKKAVCKRAA